MKQGGLLRLGTCSWTEQKHCRDMRFLVSPRCLLGKESFMKGFGKSIEDELQSVSQSVGCREWAERCDITQLFDRYGPVKFYKSFRICSEHFDTKYIVFDGRKKKLRNCAVPRVVKPKKRIKLVRVVVESRHENPNIGVTQKLLENLCRFCAEENTELTDIYSCKGKALELEEKIKVFPIRVSKLDKLPLKICNLCIVKINKFHEFVRNCVKADIRLKTILGTVDCPSCETTEVPEESQHKVGLSQDVKSVDKAELQKYEGSNRKVFLLVQCDETRTKDGIDDDIQSDNTLHNADAGFSYVSKQEDVLLTDANDVFGKKISVSSEGNATFDRYICSVCSKTFSALEILESHWKAHSLQPDEFGKFVCQICNKIFPNKYRLNEHNRVHTGEYPFKCSTCNKKFHKMALLKQHSIIHESNKPFVCSVCNLRSNRKGNLIQHFRTHSHKVLKMENAEMLPQLETDSTKSDCFQKLILLTKISTIQHEKDTPNNTVKLICGTCQEQFIDSETLEQHFRSHSHSIRTERYAKAKLTTRNRKAGHQRIYQCEECGVRFKRKDTLTNHVRIHTGERPFVCGSCGFAFKQKGDCLKHERNHRKTTEEDTENCS